MQKDFLRLETKEDFDKFLAAAALLEDTGIERPEPLPANYSQLIQEVLDFPYTF